MPRTITRIAHENLEKDSGDAKLAVVGIHMAGTSAAVAAIETARHPRVQVHCLQDLHRATETE